MEDLFELYRELRSLLGEKDLGVELRQQIHCIIQEAIDQIPGETGIAIRPAGEDTKKLLKSYDFSKKKIVGIVSPHSHGDDFCGYPCFTMDSFSSISCDCVIISSFYFRQEIKEELETHNIPYIDIYNELEKRGIQLCIPYHLYEAFPQLIVNVFYLRFLRSKAGPQREIALRELLQVAVEWKDFTLIGNIYRDCGGENGDFPLLKAVWKKSGQLLDCIQNKLQERKQKDIIMFWTDAVPYDMLRYLPETMELSGQGVFFQRAYTHTPYTDSTMRAMFCNMLPIDDFPQNQEKIDSGNSSLIQFLENAGYKVRFVGASERAMGDEHQIEAETYLPCSMKWWKGIVELLQSPEPCFYMFHFTESHNPNFVPDLKKPVNTLRDMFGTDRTRWEAQKKAALGYLDQCLALYHKLLGNKTQIFFSDHGDSLWEEPWKEQVLHPYCFAVGDNIPRKTITRFFPYRNFEGFVRWLLDPAHHLLDDVCTDELIFQDTDFFNPERIELFIKKGDTRSGIAFRGILNYDCKYVINALGEELFFKMQQDGSEKPVPLEDPVLRTELRDKIGTEFLDIYQHNEFRYARKLYDFIKSNKT